MSIENLKTWHWLLIGAIIGLLVGYASTFAGPDRDSVMRAPLTAGQFAENLGRDIDGQPFIKDVVLHPAHGGQNFVTGEVLFGDRYKPFAFYAEIPFKRGAVTSPSVREFIETAVQRNAKITYAYAWSEAIWFILLSRAAIGAILIGGLWPVLLNLMIGAGFGRKKTADVRYDLDRFKGEPPPQDTQPSPVDHQHLQELEEELEQNLLNQTATMTQATAPTQAAAVIKQLNSDPLETHVTPTPEEEKDYRGEFYPVAKPHVNGKRAFSLVELIVVIAMIAVLIAMLLPAIKRARQSAQIATCANNLREIGHALQMYLNENQYVTFWRGENLDTDGMDWYAYGGRETGNLNLDQGNYFNRIIPRPLNHYVRNKLEIFHCPNDDAAPWTYDVTYTIYRADSQYEWVGNSYNFNANGYPLREQPRHDGGLDGEKFSSISSASQTVVFFEACLYYGFDWHHSHKGNTAFADNHVEFIPLPEQEGQYRWNP
jgi:prepilin-type N-terminal cleavage/methylation domain-containing protein/prepilin-type processing-associated H-X9-DG protein